MTDGQIVAFINYLSTTMGPLLLMTLLANTWANGIASAGRVNEVLDTQPEVQDLPGALPLPLSAQTRVAFEEVSFHYNGSSETTVLDHIYLAAEPGKTIAILGATGAGKSSLINLIPRFYDPTQGNLEIDGVDIRTVKQDSLLAHVGIVPQETILFSGSVRDNIRYGKPEASEEEVVAAASAAQAHEFIEGFPNGYETIVGERGVTLSGGQRQRVAIARALLMNPRILILDDSLSSVDTQTEKLIQAALDTLMEGRTTFVIAHRLSTVRRADMILVMDKGRIVQHGTHDELLREGGLYKEIHDLQLVSHATFSEDMEALEAVIEANPNREGYEDIEE
jgi:ATP-binding cassette subfamily B protein